MATASGKKQGAQPGSGHIDLVVIKGTKCTNGKMGWIQWLPKNALDDPIFKLVSYWRRTNTPSNIRNRANTSWRVETRLRTHKRNDVGKRWTSKNTSRSLRKSNAYYERNTGRLCKSTVGCVWLEHAPTRRWLVKAKNFLIKTLIFQMNNVFCICNANGACDGTCTLQQVLEKEEVLQQNQAADVGDSKVSEQVHWTLSRTEVGNMEGRKIQPEIPHHQTHLPSAPVVQKRPGCILG